MTMRKYVLTFLMSLSLVTSCFAGTGDPVRENKLADVVFTKMLKGDTNTETLSGDKTLTISDLMNQILDPNGSDRDIIFPPEADSTDLRFYIYNAADGSGEDLTVKNDASAEIVTLGPGMGALFTCNGTDWVAFGEDGIVYDAQANTTNIKGIAIYDSNRTISNLHHLVDKKYVDKAVTSLGARYYMIDTASGESDYKLCSTTASSDSEESITKLDLADNEYIAGWISPNTNEPNKLIAGVYDWRIYAEKIGGNQTLRFYWELIERKSDDSETVIGTSVTSNEVIAGKDSYIIPLTLSEDYDISSDSYVVGKIYANVTGSGGAPDLKVYYEGDSDSHWKIPTNIEILNDQYVNITGDTMTGTLTVPSMNVAHVTQPVVKLYNTAEENTNGGRESRIVGRGEKADGTAHDLGEIVFEHDGTGDDKKGQVKIKVNDGDDADGSLQTVVTVDSSGNVGIGAKLEVNGDIIISGAQYKAITTPDLTGNTYTITAEQYTVLINDDDTDVTDTLVVTLPEASLNSGRVLKIKKIGSGQTVRLDGNGSETIDSNLIYDLTIQNEAVTLQCDGTAWYLF